MQNNRIVPLGELSASGAVTDWILLSSKVNSLAKILVVQVTAKGVVTAADVDIEYSIDGNGAMPLVNVLLSTNTQSDGASDVGQLAKFARARLKGISGGGSVVPTLIVED